MGKPLILILLIGISFSANAQKDSTESLRKDITILSITNEGAFSFGGGIGYSTIELRLYGLINGGDGAGATSETPAYNAYLDYGIEKKTCIGLAFSYQSVTGIPANNPSGIIEYITRYNFGLRVIHYTSSNIPFSFYYGGRIGISDWTDKFNNPQFNFDYTLQGPTQSDISFQFFIGYRILLSDNFAFHIEGGIGTPYLIEGGFGFRI